ncbi:MAG: ATP-binding protein [Paludibacteraceae bacterium]|nr:ATP-binding protein [Paludibacteraceae bacterium]
MKKTECEMMLYDATKSFIDNFEILVEAVENCELKESFIEQYREYIYAVCDVLKLTDQEVIMLCPFLKNSDKIYDFGDIAKFYNCSSMRIVRYTSALKTLKKKGYIKKDTYQGREGFKILYNALETISQGKSIENGVLNNELSPMEFMKRLNAVFESARRRSYDFETGRRCNIEGSSVDDEVMILLRNNTHLNISCRILDMPISKLDKTILLYFCTEAVWDNNMTIDCDTMKRIFDSEGLFAYREILAGEHELAKRGLIEVVTEEGMFGEGDELSLTETAQVDLLKPDFNFIQKKKGKTYHNVIKSESIVEKGLFFREQNKASLEVLKGLLDEGRMVEIRQQLKSKGWGLGFTCLFYGSPGTGKTESVLQLARETGRDIMQVDISLVRTKWYGETEKSVKKVFTDYKDFVAKSEKTPILLFNEADAILSVRTELGVDSTSCTKTENTIQNILLQEMETLDGILIATTNLTNNLDAAFERRFLYKIKFEKPDIEAKGEIWRSLMPSLTKEDAQILASEFDFSGGEISNIARKCFINELLFNQSTSLEQIKATCDQEKLIKRTKIGF